MNELKIYDRKMVSKAREVRSEGFVPGIIYGKHINSMPVKMKRSDLLSSLSKDGEIYQVKNRDGNKMIMLKYEELQRNPVSHEIIHFSLQELPRGEENTLEVPIQFSGTPIGNKKNGILMVLKESLNLEGKPKDFPNHFEVNLDSLDINDKITVGDIAISKNLTCLDDSEQVIATCQPPNLETEENAEEAQETQVANSAEPMKI